MCVGGGMGAAGIFENICLGTLQNRLTTKDTKYHEGNHTLV